MLREVLEVLVLPNSFRSIDFSRKGVYCFTFRLITEGSESNTHGYLFHLKAAQPEHQFQSAVDNETGVYRTQGFFISFNSERLEFLPGGCLFRVEGPWKGTALQLEVKLMHIDTDSLNNPLISPTSFKLKAVKKVRVEKYRDYYGDVILGEFDYFCAVETAIHVTRLDYRFRLCNYQLSDFVSQTKKEEVQKQQESKKQIRVLPNREIKALLATSVESISLESFHLTLVVKQLSNYQKLLEKYRKYLNYMTELELIGFWRRHHILPKDLSYLQWSPSETTPSDHLKTHYQVTEEEDVYSSILLESNLIGKNIRYIWMLNYELESFLLKRRFNDMRQQFEIDLFYESRRKYFRPYNSDREFQIRRFKTERGYSRSEEGKYPLIFGPFFDFPKKKLGHILVVMVHGFQGSDYDMDLVKNYLMSYNKNIYCYVVRTLEGTTVESIELLGEKFAKETLNVMAKMAGDFQSVSFIGYSLGGIVIRAGLKHLEVIKDKVNVVLTLASPHLGVSMLDNVLVRTGVWYMSKVENYSSMRSLAQIDNYMHQLSEDESLTWIKKLVVLGCKEDQFVPGYSAKILQTGTPSIDALYDNIVERVQNILRIEVWFDSMPKMIDKLIGRKAHIEFLESKEFSESFFSVFARIF